MDSMKGSIGGSKLEVCVILLSCSDSDSIKDYVVKRPISLRNTKRTEDRGHRASTKVFLILIKY